MDCKSEIELKLQIIIHITVIVIHTIYNILKLSKLKFSLFKGK